MIDTEINFVKFITVSFRAFINKYQTAFVWRRPGIISLD